MRAAPHDNVVYILGAGFSAQFGLPVMSNFLEKARDIVALRNIETRRINELKINLDNFETVFRNIETLRRCKDYYNADFLNIEEILSLLDMGELVGSQTEGEQSKIFRNFIADVIKYYTVDEPPYSQEKNTYSLLLPFLKYLFRVDCEPGELTRNVRSDVPFYSILTFNYDNVLENALGILNYECQFDQLSFSNSYNKKGKKVPLIKIHGDVCSPASIVAPTWRKKFEPEQSGFSAWKTAGEILREANHIRIIGYSLPDTDSYLKYFLKWGAAHEQNLKSIDVICLDDSASSVENRYKKFIISSRLSFFNKSTEDYLSFIEEAGDLEAAHEKLFS